MAELLIKSGYAELQARLARGQTILKYRLSHHLSGGSLIRLVCRAYDTCDTLTAQIETIEENEAR